MNFHFIYGRTQFKLNELNDSRENQEKQTQENGGRERWLPCLTKAHTRRPSQAIHHRNLPNSSE